VSSTASSLEAESLVVSSSVFRDCGSSSLRGRDWGGVILLYAGSKKGFGSLISAGVFASSFWEEAVLFSLGTLLVLAIAPWAGPFTTHTRVQTGQSGGVLVYETRDPVLLVSGKVRHAQGQRLNRCEVREREKSERTKGEGEMSTLFPSFLTPHFNLILKVSIG